MEKKVKILVAAHKADPAIRQDEVYMPIHVGKSLHPDVELGYQGDNTGDNISDKNPSYCELTALYWAWKNLKDINYIGLAHYRRYFKGINDKKEIELLLKKYDVVTLEKRSLPTSVAADLEHLLSMEEVAIMIDTLISSYPEMKQDVIDYFYRGNKVSQCNMFIMKWKDFQEYCEFLFPLLKQIEGKLPKMNFARQRRNIGYMAEALQGLYIKHKGMKVKECEKQEIGLPQQNQLIKRMKCVRDYIVFNFFRHPNKIYVYDSVRVGLINDHIHLSSI